MLVGENLEEVDNRLEERCESLEGKVLKISRSKTSCIKFDFDLEEIWVTS